MEDFMKKYYYAITTLVFLLLLTNFIAIAESEIKSGDVVFAEWVSNGWYHGTVGDECGNNSFTILFDDGDTKCCLKEIIVPDIIPRKMSVLPGKKVLAQWSNGRFYPGIVSGINGDVYNINFDDGEKGKVTLDQIRIRE